jgi:hypothetical protein
MKKIIVIGVIVLFICVGFQSAFAVEPKLSADNIIKVKDYDCQEVSKDDILKFKELLNDLKDFTINVMTRFGYIPEVKEKCQEILDFINEVRQICIFTALTIIYILGMVLVFAILTVDAGEGTLMYYIYNFIGQNWANRYWRWVSLYEDVLKCGEWLHDPPSKFGNKLVKLNEIKQIMPNRLMIGS